MPDPKASSAWIIFDADNTLWDVEALYDQARDEFCEFVETCLAGSDPPCQLDRALIDALQRHRDIQLHLTRGYTAARFARSFEDTLAFLLPFSPPETVRRSRELAFKVFDRKPRLTPGLEAVLAELGVGHSLGIVTAGERWVQERRMSQFAYRELFKEVAIVDRKTEETFTTICRSWNVDRASSWMVGDSLRSDVMPATKAGLRCVHFLAANWIVEQGVRPPGVPAAASMEEVLAIIRA